MAKRKEKKDSAGKPKEKSSFHDELEGFDIRVNAFGEMESTIDMDQLNAFLNQRIRDKKLNPPDASEEE